MSNVTVGALLAATISWSAAIGTNPTFCQDGSLKGKIVGIETSAGSAMSIVKAMGRDGSIEAVSQIDRGVSLARVSPDGKRIAYVVERDDASAIRLLSVGSGHSSLLLDTQKGAWIGGWSPDGMRLVFGYGDRGSRANSIITIKTRELHPIDLPKTELVWDWSPDGKELVTISEPAEEQPRQIQRVMLEDSRITCLTDRTTDNILPRFSPDGNRILFSSTRTRRAQVYVMDRDGGNVRQLTSFGDRSTGWACWSPDGKEICCRSFKTGPVNDEGGYDIFEPHLVLINADGTDPKVFVPPGSSDGWFLDWR